MTEMPPGRPSEPRTGPAAPAPAHDDGPTGPSAPTGRTEPRNLAWFLARTPPSDGHAPPCTPGDWNRQSIAAFIARHSPEEAPMPEPADRPPSLRDRIADALHCPTCGVEPGAHCLRARVDNRQPHMTRVQAADAVMPVVEAETAALRQRAEEAERLAARYRLQVDDPDSLLVQLDQARDAIAAERRGRLAAEAAARRAREIHRRHDCARHVNPRTPVPCVNEGLCDGCAARYPCQTATALDAEEAR